MKVVETVFREAHSLKGAARAVGMAEIESICQAAESVFSALKHAQLALSPALLDLLHDAVDAVGKLLPVAGRDTSGKGSTPSAGLLERLEAAVKGTATVPAKADAAVPGRAPQPRPDAPEEKPVLADTVRIAAPRLHALLFQVEELLSAKLTAAQRAAEIREAVGALGALKKKRAGIVPAMNALRTARERAARRNGSEGADPQVRKLA